MRLDCSAPSRIDFAGGTMDIWPLYLFHDRAQTINAAISLRAECSISSRTDGRVALTSSDTGERVDAASAHALAVDALPLVARLVKHFDVSGIDVSTRSGSPVGAGIGGSSAMNIAVTSALAAWTGRSLDPDDLLALAMNIEAQVIRVPTGVQDYRPALYGGVSAVELTASGVRRVALSVDAGELSQRLVVAYTGASRQSGINNWEVMKRRIDGDAHVTKAFDDIRDASVAMRAALEAGDWTAASDALAGEWRARKTLAPAVTTPTIDALLDAAMKAGATAGKVCGAGGGGCLFCLAPPDRTAAVSAVLKAHRADVLPVQVESQGVIIRKH